MTRAQSLEAEYREILSTLPPPKRAPGTEAAEARWSLEELRVSLFAQSLGTPRPISEPRLRRLLASLTHT